MIALKEGSLAEAMKKAKSEVPLENLGIASVSFRRMRTGGLILEIPSGKESRGKADRRP